MKLQRRQLRIKTLEILYQMEFQDHQQYADSPPLDAYNLYLKEGVISNKKEIDQLIHQHSKNWKMERLSLLDLNILRIAIYEMLFNEEKNSSKIYINEAIEIAKIYSATESPKFINGILDAIAKSKNLI